MSEHEHTAGGRLARWRERGRVKRRQADEQELFDAVSAQREATASSDGSYRSNAHTRSRGYGTEVPTFWSLLFDGGGGGGGCDGGGGCGGG